MVMLNTGIQKPGIDVACLVYATERYRCYSVAQVLVVAS